MTRVGDYLGVRAFFYGDGRVFVASVLPLLIVGWWLPIPMWWTAGSVLLAIGSSYAMSYLLLRGSYVIIYRPLVHLLDRRYRALPVRLDDFYILLSPFAGKHLIGVPDRETPTVSVLRSSPGRLITWTGAVAGSSVAAVLAYSGYLDGLVTVSSTVGLGVFLTSAFAAGGMVGYGGCSMWTLYAAALGDVFVRPAGHFLRSLRPSLHPERFEPTVPYDQRTVDLFRAYRDQLQPAAHVSRSTRERDSLQDVLSTLRDGRVVVEADRVTIDGIVLPVRTEPSSGLVPDPQEARLINIISTVRNMKKVAISLLLDEPVLLVGESGVGKSAVVRYLAATTTRGFRRFNLSGQTEKTELIGGYRPDETGNFVWMDGSVIRAMRAGDILVLDELNLAESQVLERINSLLDDDRHLRIPEKDGMLWIRAETYDAQLDDWMTRTGLSGVEAQADAERRNLFRIHPGFRLVATMNPVEYAGRNILSPALMGRFKVKWIDEPYSLERQAVFHELFKDADNSPLVDWGTLDRIDFFHTRLRSAAETRGIGRAERDPYYYSIRDLLKLGRRIRTRVDELDVASGTKMSALARREIAGAELADVYASRIRDPEDRQHVMSAIEELFGGMADASRQPSPFVETGHARCGWATRPSRRGPGAGPTCLTSRPHSLIPT